MPNIHRDGDTVTDSAADVIQLATRRVVKAAELSLEERVVVLTEAVSAVLAASAVLAERVAQLEQSLSDRS